MYPCVGLVWQGGFLLCLGIFLGLVIGSECVLLFKSAKEERGSSVFYMVSHVFANCTRTRDVNQVPGWTNQGTHHLGEARGFSLITSPPKSANTLVNCPCCPVSKADFCCTRGFSASYNTRILVN